MNHQTDKAGADKTIRKAVTNTKMYLGNARLEPINLADFPQKLHDTPDMRALK